MNIVLGTLLANATLRVDAPKKLKVFQRGAVLAPPQSLRARLVGLSVTDSVRSAST